MGKTLRVLMVEEIEANNVLLLQELQIGGYDPIFIIVDTLDAIKAALRKQRWDIAIGNFPFHYLDLPDILELLQDDGINIPFIILLDNRDINLIDSALRAGVHDYVVKDRMGCILPILKRELQEPNQRC